VNATVHHFPTPEIEAQPSNIEAEAMLLGALMLDNKRIDQAADLLKQEDFAEPFYGHVFGLMVKEVGQGHPANPLTLKPFISEEGARALAGLTGSMSVHLVQVRDTAQQIVDLAARRRLIETLKTATEQAADCNNNLDGVAADVEAALLDTSGRDGLIELSGSGCITKALEAVGKNDRGVTCGIGAIDEAMGPIRKKALAIVAARPGMGKSALAVSYALGAAHKGHGVLIVSLEMSAEDIGERMACDLCFDAQVQVPYAKLVAGTLNHNEVRAVSEAAEALQELPVQVLDTSALSVARLASIVRRWKRRMASRGQSLDLVIVDYLQLLRSPGSNGRYEVITEISQSLKEIAKANDLGIMALSQLSRKVEERGDKRPMLSDLRESGQIEQDADSVLFLLRREYYLSKEEPAEHHPDRPAWEQAMMEHRGQIEFICAKRRKGQEGTTLGSFFGQFQAVR
jgi:replicative DNA helicase